MTCLPKRLLLPLLAFFCMSVQAVERMMDRPPLPMPVAGPAGSRVSSAALVPISLITGDDPSPCTAPRIVDGMDKLVVGKYTACRNVAQALRDRQNFEETRQFAAPRIS